MDFIGADQTDPLEIFKQWFGLAQTAGNFEPTQMLLATTGLDGMPAARVVLLKQFDEQGFCFFTNYQSDKAKELEKTPSAALVFHWEKPFHRQIRVRGSVEKLASSESAAYFATRPRGSQIGAWASPQSQVISSRDELEVRLQEIEERFRGKEVPCPDFWGGFRLRPLIVEFWQGQEFRLHDRQRFIRKTLDSSWTSLRLAP